MISSQPIKNSETIHVKTSRPKRLRTSTNARNAYELRASGTDTKRTTFHRWKMYGCVTRVSGKPSLFSDSFHLQHIAMAPPLNLHLGWVCASTKDGLGLKRVSIRKFVVSHNRSTHVMYHGWITFMLLMRRTFHLQITE